MSRHGPAELNHSETRRPPDRSIHREIPGRTEVYFGPEDDCPAVAVVEGPDRGEIGARIVACFNALDGIPEPEKFIRLAKELIDKECLRGGSPQIWDTQEED